MSPNASLSRGGLVRSAASGEVEDEHHQCDDQQDVNKTASDVKCESAAPEQHEENCEDQYHAHASHPAVKMAVRG